MLVELKRDATMLDVINAINLLSSAEPGMNPMISKEFEKVNAKMICMEKEKQALVNDMNKIAKFLDRKINSCWIKDRWSFGFIFGKRMFIWSIKNLINKKYV